MSNLQLNDGALPGLFQASDKASIKAQSSYYLWLRAYLVLLTLAALVSFVWPTDVWGAIASAILFVIALVILVMLRITSLSDIWYNSRAVAESVKTRSWRWVMRAEPYVDTPQVETAVRQFIDDLREILKQNTSLSRNFPPSAAGLQSTVSETMKRIRALSVSERLKVYKEQRINDQALWYASRSRTNKRRASVWLWVSVTLHIVAVVLLLYKIANLEAKLPIEVIATAAGAALTWLESKKYNELTSSYALAAHEIGFIQGTATTVRTEEELADFVLNTEYAFSREHTQYVARKSG